MNKPINQNRIKGFFFVSFLLVAISAIAQEKTPHQQWDKLLKKHVDATGLVNYKGFQKDKAKLEAYLKTLSNEPPQNNWTDNEQKAYWINAYNAFTISLILKYYPVKSIKDIGSTKKSPVVNTPWDIKFIHIGAKKYDLNTIEHNILRKKFDDPRIHFALVCASISCPRLRNEAYNSARLNAQLEAAGRDFLNDQSKNKISLDKAILSKYFSWYTGDFTKDGSLSNFINKYSATKINKSTRISYLDYNWSLNEKK